MKGISDAKRILIKKTESSGKTNISVTAYVHYRFESSTELSTTLLKRGKKPNITLRRKQISHVISDEKKHDVACLLEKQFGRDRRNRRELLYYKTILDNQQETEEEEQDGILCECIDPDEPIVHF